MAITLFCVNGHYGWRRGVAVECRIRDQEIAGSSLGRALRRKKTLCKFLTPMCLCHQAV